MDEEILEKDKKYYWLKLKRDFFKRHDIQIIEAMPNGKDYILFYLKLLCESVDHDGNLRFSEEIPYNEQMLATITNTNIDIVRSAILLFAQLKMMDVMDNGTYYMREVQKMLGGETYWAAKKREQREKLPEVPQIGQCPIVSNESPTCPSKSKSKSKSIEKELELENDGVPDINVGHKSKRFTPPTVDEVRSYCGGRQNDVDPQRFVDYYTSNGWMVGKNKMKDWKAAVRTWEQKASQGGYSQTQVKPRNSNPFLDMLEEGVYD